jgi:hypothetical protein
VRIVARQEKKRGSVERNKGSAMPEKPGDEI